MSNRTTQIWRDRLSSLLVNGASQSPRGQSTREIIGCKTVIDMKDPVVLDATREISYQFMLAEAWYILSGRNDVASIAAYAPSIGRFSDDGETFAGAYGPPVIDQMEYVIGSLCNDPSTRQSVLQIWNRNPEPSKDIPCTLGLQFLIRDNVLHCVATMRSSDVWIGFIYDIFVFSAISTYVAIEYRRRTGITLSLGDLHLTAGSQHLYERNIEKAREVLKKRENNLSRANPLNLEVSARVLESGKSLIGMLNTLKDRV